jgi:3-hydroxyisobutyrate dehydrogenase-like beta-hydroxyacid dehydrogenase
MAANLFKAGHEVTVWNRTPKTVDGARVATPAEAAQVRNSVMCVSDTKAVEAVLFGPNGAEASCAKAW